jgi:crossover junction endodeoxyribonuclease RuvC
MNKKIKDPYSTIISIDPGYGRMGIAILKTKGSDQKLIYSECFETEAKLPHPLRLFNLGNRIEEMIKEFSPNQLAIETLLWSKNKKTALLVAEARGVVLAIAAKNNLKIREFNPNQIKLAVTGYGKSDKNQVINMINRLLKIKEKKRYDDEYDAIAVAITCASIPQSTIQLS